jgi:predicted dehydrogenase
MPDNVNLLLVGAGPMAISYAQVLTSLKKEFCVIGRGEVSARQFQEKTFIEPIMGGVESYLKEHTVPATAIIATSVENLASCAKRLIEAGVKNILLEKPGGLDISQIEEIGRLARLRSSRVIVAYNRRFYTSVERAKNIIEEDGGLRALYFEFTEWSHVVEHTKKPAIVKAKWFLANSTHVVDLAFHLAGLPEKWCYNILGGNNWHPSGTRFVGSGITDQNILFTYQADWESAGRWGIELQTAKRKLYLRPMEQLFVQEKGSLQIEQEHIYDDRDLQYKPGLYRQVEAFLKGKDTVACTLEEQLRNMTFYNLMAGY